MVRIDAGGHVFCNHCGAEMKKEAGYYRCLDCGWRFYGDPHANPYNDGCSRCGVRYLKSQRQCPNCGLT